GLARRRSWPIERLCKALGFSRYRYQTWRKSAQSVGADHCGQHIAVGKSSGEVECTIRVGGAEKNKGVGFPLPGYGEHLSAARRLACFAFDDDAFDMRCADLPRGHRNIGAAISLTTANLDG